MASITLIFLYMLSLVQGECIHQTQALIAGLSTSLAIPFSNCSDVKLVFQNDPDISYENDIEPCSHVTVNSTSISLTLGSMTPATSLNMTVNCQPNITVCYSYQVVRSFSEAELHLNNSVSANCPMDMKSGSTNTTNSSVVNTSQTLDTIPSAVSTDSSLGSIETGLSTSAGSIVSSTNPSAVDNQTTLSILGTSASSLSDSSMSSQGVIRSSMGSDSLTSTRLDQTSGSLPTSELSGASTNGGSFTQDSGMTFSTVPSTWITTRGSNTISGGGEFSCPCRTAM